jgi:hypothetical protein
MSQDTTSRPIDQVLFRRDIYPRAARLCDGRFDLPLRVMIGFIKQRALKVERLLDYNGHVATLALVFSGLHRHDAALRVATRNAGAFAGSPDEFAAWEAKRKIKYDHLMATTLPDGSRWVTWSRNRQPQTKLIPSVFGWSGGLVEFDKLLMANPERAGMMH